MFEAVLNFEEFDFVLVALGGLLMVAFFFLGYCFVGPRFYSKGYSVGFEKGLEKGAEGYYMAQSRSGFKHLWHRNGPGGEVRRG